MMINVVTLSASVKAGIVCKDELPLSSFQGVEGSHSPHIALGGTPGEPAGKDKEC
jgi:hypothetical protein